MKRRLFAHFAAAVLAVASLGLAPFAHAAEESPDALIKRLSDEGIHFQFTDAQATNYPQRFYKVRSP